MNSSSSSVSNRASLRTTAGSTSSGGGVSAFSSGKQLSDACVSSGVQSLTSGSKTVTQAVVSRRASKSTTVVSRSTKSCTAPSEQLLSVAESPSAVSRTRTATDFAQWQLRHSRAASLNAPVQLVSSGSVCSNSKSSLSEAKMHEFACLPRGSFRFGCRCPSARIVDAARRK